MCQFRGHVVPAKSVPAPDIANITAKSNFSEIFSHGGKNCGLVRAAVICERFRGSLARAAVGAHPNKKFQA